MYVTKTFVHEPILVYHQSVRAVAEWALFNGMQFADNDVYPCFTAEHTDGSPLSGTELAALLSETRHGRTVSPIPEECAKRTLRLQLLPREG